MYKFYTVLLSIFIYPLYMWNQNHIAKLSLLMVLSGCAAGVDFDNVDYNDNYLDSYYAGEYITDLAVSYNHMCVVTNHQKTYCKGDKDNFGVDFEDDYYTDTFVEASSFHSAIGVITNTGSTCVLQGDQKTIQCLDNSYTLKEESDLIDKIVSGESNFCVLTKNKKVLCSVYVEGSPTLATPLILEEKSFKNISSSLSAVCATDLEDKVLCTGSDTFGQLGVAVGDYITDSESPINASTLFSGPGHTFCARDNEVTKCWGKNKTALANFPLYISNLDLINDEEPLSSATAVLSDIDHVRSSNQIQFSDMFACGLEEHRNLNCWGQDHPTVDIGMQHFEYIKIRISQNKVCGIIAPNTIYFDNNVSGHIACHTTANGSTLYPLPINIEIQE